MTRYFHILHVLFLELWTEIPSSWSSIFWKDTTYCGSMQDDHCLRLEFVHFSINNLCRFLSVLRDLIWSTWDSRHWSSWDSLVWFIICFWLVQTPLVLCPALNRCFKILQTVKDYCNSLYTLWFAIGSDYDCRLSQTIADYSVDKKLELAEILWFKFDLMVLC